jgi:hypothetical protein
MSSRCLRTLLLVLPLLAVACGDDSDGGTPPELTPPTVREIQPTGGPIAGNTLLNVYGSGFQDGAKVFLGDQELQRTVVVNAFRIYGYTPTATSAQVDVRVVNPDGAYGVLVKGFTYEGPPAPNIDQAEVLNGNTDAVSGGQPVGITVRGAITVAGLTRGVGQAGGVRAQVGFAPGDSELLKMDSYTWEAATYETDSDSGEADVYKGNVLLQPAIGGENREWVVSIRFSIDGGKTWVMADGDGIANGVSAEMMRRVFIARPRVDYCKLGPDGNGANPELFYKPTDSTLIKVAGQVYAAGITQGAGGGSGLVAQLGIGPADSDPRDATGWTWINATYKAEHGNNDEWEADLPNPGTEGKYRVAFRFSISENAWRVCDADGVNDSTEGNLTFSLAKLGTLTVGNEAPKPQVGWCKIGEDQKAPETINYLTTQTSGQKTVYAQVFMTGVTDKVGAGPGLTGQLGWGPANEDPRTSALWNWSTNLAWNKDNFDVNDEWKGTLPNPGVNGEYRYAVRFAANGGPVRVCDGNGVDDGGQDFELNQLGTLNVTGEVVVPKVIGYCKLGPDGNNTPETVTYATTATASRKVLGQVYVPSVTTSPGKGDNVVAQLGWGPSGDNPATSASWNWSTAAAYKGDIGGNNDEYEATLPNPGVVGSSSFAYRFQVNGGAFLYCDADGNSGGAAGFDTTKLGTLNVTGEVVVPKVVGYCKLGPDGNTTPETVAYVTTATASRKVLGQVWVQDVTPGTGAGVGVIAQLGWGPTGENPATSANWNWSTAATYKGDIGGNNDEYEATLPNPGAVGTSSFAYRFQVNGGAFLYCDADGNSGGASDFDTTKLGTLTVSAPQVPTTIGYCKLGPDGNTTPETVAYVTTATANRKVVGQVWVQGVTTGTGKGDNVVAQLGWGPAGENPTTSANWSWATSGAYKGDIGDNDEYEATLPNPGVVGSYGFAYRFQVNGGAFLYCDADGNSGGAAGFDTAKLGTLTVSAPQAPTTVGYCKLGPDGNTTPDTVTYVSTAPADRKVVGQLWVDGVTAGAGAGAGVVGQLGWGPSGEDPTTSSQWSWSTAQFKNDFFDNDEYDATLPNPGVVGNYRFAYRFQVNGGAFLYCDADGNSTGAAGFDATKTGTLVVEAPPAPLAVCRLQSVSGTTVGSGDAVTATGRVRIAGVTDGSGAPAGNLQVQVGVGASDVDASANPAAFTWKVAPYTGEASGEANTDEFSTTVHPAYTGVRAVSLRYSTDGATWTYCDKDGSDVGGYTLGQQHVMTVNNHSGIDYCNLQWPLKISDSRTVYGKIYEGGITDAPPPAANLTAELGYGPKAHDPGVGADWTWIAGVVNSDGGNDDEYKADMPASAPVGHSYLWRYRVGTGPYCYGDWQPDGQSGGSSNGVSPDTLGTIDQ